MPEEETEHSKVEEQLLAKSRVAVPDEELRKQLTEKEKDDIQSVGEVFGKGASEKRYKEMKTTLVKRLFDKKKKEHSSVLNLLKRKQFGRLSKQELEKVKSFAQKEAPHVQAGIVTIAKAGFKGFKKLYGFK